LDKEEKYGVGTIHENKKGLKFEIIEKIDSRFRKIKFLVSGYENSVLIGSISKKSIKDYPNRIKNGQNFNTKEGYNLVVHNYINFDNIWVKFKNHEKHIFKTSGKELRNGNIKNPYHNSILGVGCFGVGDYASSYSIGKISLEYQTWRDMLRRCYDEKELLKRPNYKNVSVCKEWLNFQNYARWFDENKPNIDTVKFHVDKDLLQMGIESKVYSPKTCCFIPISINSFLTNNHLNHNTSGYTGVSLVKGSGKWKAQINDFKTGKYIAIKCNCETKEEAYELYKEYRAENSEKAKEYLRSLNYLSEEVIQLIK
jgi:hypothetical protein